MPMCFIYTGLSYGSHTIRVTNGSAASLTVDYFTTLRPADSCAPFVLFHDPYETAAAYSGTQASKAAIDTANTKACDSLINAMPVAWRNKSFVIPVNTVYQITNDTYTDGIHPNNSGMKRIANLANSTINRSRLIPGNIRVSADSLIYANGRRLMYVDELGLQNAVESNGTFLNSDTIRGVGTNTFNVKNFSNIQLGNLSLTGANSKFSGTIWSTGTGSGIIFGSRDIDTTKGWSGYSQGSRMRFFNLFTNKDCLNLDTGGKIVILPGSTNPSVVTSALQIATTSGKPIASFQIDPSPLLAPANFVKGGWENRDNSRIFFTDSSQAVRHSFNMSANFTNSTSSTASFTMFTQNVPNNILMEFEFTIEAVDVSGNTAFIRRMVRLQNNAGTVTIKGGGLKASWTDDIDAGLGTPTISTSISGTLVSFSLSPGNSNITTWYTIKDIPRQNAF
jgi:hypothetical protein